MSTGKRAVCALSKHSVENQYSASGVVRTNKKGEALGYLRLSSMSLSEEGSLILYLPVRDTEGSIFSELSSRNRTLAKSVA
jgi:hypothetical protein